MTAAFLVAVLSAAIAAVATPLDGALDDVASLNQPDNDTRRAALVALIEAAGLEYELHAFPNDGREGDARETGHNVVVTIGSGARDIVIGAHIDAVALKDGTMVQGAVDNGASAVVVLRAARELARRGTDHRLVAVFFDMEEIGLIGSKHFAATLDPERVTAMINLDVNGYGDTLFYGHTRDGHTALYQALEASCTAERLRCVDFPRYPPTDNISFQRAGFANVSLSVLPVTEVHQLWLAMNAGKGSGLAEGFVPAVFHNIHSANDTIERIEPEAMEIAYRALVALVREIDD